MTFKNLAHEAVCIMLEEHDELNLGKTNIVFIFKYSFGL